MCECVGELCFCLTLFDKIAVTIMFVVLVGLTLWLARQA